MRPGAELRRPPPGCPGRRPPCVDRAGLPAAPAPPGGLSGHRQAGWRLSRPPWAESSYRAHGGGKAKAPLPFPLRPLCWRHRGPACPQAPPVDTGPPALGAQGLRSPRGRPGHTCAGRPGTKLGTGPRCTDTPSRRAWPRGDLWALSLFCRSPVLLWPRSRALGSCGLGTDAAGRPLAETRRALSRPSPYRGGCAASRCSACAWSRWRVRLSAPQVDGDRPSWEREPRGDGESPCRGPESVV